jgi:dihydrofolate reductase
MALPIVSLVYAISRNGVIGRDGGLPWRLKSDMALFKQTTLFKPVIMGRKTWDSLPKKPLPGRLNVVLSRDGSFEPKGAVVCEGLDEALQIAREQATDDGAEEVCVIGGAGVFVAVLPKARRLYVTEVDVVVEGDTHLPPLNESLWREVRREAHPAGPEDDHAFVFRVLERA